METTRIFSFIVISSTIISLLSACSSKNSEKTKNQDPTNISKSDYNQLIASSKSEKQKNLLNSSTELQHYMSVTKGNFNEVRKSIIKDGGEIVYSDKLTGYIHFKYSPSKTIDFVKKNNFEIFLIDKSIETKHYSQPKDKMLNPESELILNNLSSVKLMKADKLISQFKEQYNIDLDCSSSTIAVFDTGIDISRTDIFQDRIVHLRSIRANDLAFVAKAQEEVIDGITYITTKLKDIKIKIEKTARLQKAENFYLGLISEQEIKGKREGFENYDLNQDGKDDGLFPIIVFKNETDKFVAYINVNDVLTYGEAGDQSIEDENLLMDFNWVSENIKDRFVENSDSAKSYYKYTTRMDIVDLDESLKADRTKGLMNLSISLEAGIELTPDGKELSPISKSEDGQIIYRVGIAGYDLMGHGTHVTGIAAGNFKTAPEYSSACTKAKIVNVANIGDAQHSSFFDELIKLSKKYRNIVFNFSFGSNQPINEIQGAESELMDLVAKTYNIPFVKAAGNEGPGIKSLGTTMSKYMIAVTNYMNTNSRQFFSNGSFLEDKVWPDSSSSRGPTHDGALKPDIGAPGWVLSALPLGKPLSPSENVSFQYWPGTSMASPNAASIVALLYDALEKSGLSKLTENSPVNFQATTLDKLRKSLLNSALPYDTFSYTVCSSSYGTSFSEWCKPIANEFKFNWLEGGAGRINALGAWNILENIQPQTPLYLNTHTKSALPGYNKKAIGYFSIGDVEPQISFNIQIDADKTPSDLTRHERFVIKIPADIDWLSFNELNISKERTVDVFGGEGASVDLFIIKEKLIENGRLKPGLHHTVIKGYNVENPDYFDLAFPVTIIGYHTAFSGLNENFQFGTNGFTTSTMFQRFFIPVTNSNGSTILNLSTSPTMPGDLSMHVYHQGIEIEPKDLGAASPWVISSSAYGEGRNSLKYIINQMPAGMYEVDIISDYLSSYLFEGIPGAYFQFNAGEMAVNIEEVSLKKMNNVQYLMIKNANNPGSLLRISDATLSISELKHESSILVKDQDVSAVPISVPQGVIGLIIETFYYGFDPKTDIDLSLEHVYGIPIAQSGNEGSDERIITPIQAGDYVLNITGYNIPAGSEEFGLKISYVLSKPIVLAKEFQGATAEDTLKAGFRWSYNKLYNFKAQYDVSKIVGMPSIPDTKFVFNLSIKALHNNEGKSTSVFNIDLE